MKEVECKPSFGFGRQGKNPTKVADNGYFNISFEQLVAKFLGFK
jgi:hypothetical protein